MGAKIREEINKKTWQKLMAMNPTLIGIVDGVRFYEHPVYGDEVSLIAQIGDSQGYTWEHDLPAATW